MKAVRTISTFLGISMFMFGVLKFFNPFKGWYSVQIMNSKLSEFSYWFGITGEIFVGILFLGCVLLRERVSQKTFSIAIIAASTMEVMMMATATRVHLDPNVPANVLPLKIKPPIIPIFFLLLAVVNIILNRRILTRQDG
jgi:putative Mn2+ efflux pump MntP